jgi:hypothetical protein
MASRGCILGDSNAADFTCPYGSFLGLDHFVYTDANLARGHNCVNLAHAGDFINYQQALWNSQSVSTKLTYDWVLIEVGLNDVNQRPDTETAAAVLARYQALVDTIRASVRPGCTILGCTFLPEKGYIKMLFPASWDTLVFPKWRAINEGIRGIGATPVTGLDGVVYEHTTALADADDNLDLPYDCGDKHHINNAGRSLFGEYCHRVLRNVGAYPDEWPYPWRGV